MLIILALGAVVILIALSALRFARMDDTAETAAFAKRKRKLVVFEGRLTPRAAREAVPQLLLDAAADEEVRVVVERVRRDSPE